MRRRAKSFTILVLVLGACKPPAAAVGASGRNPFNAAGAAEQGTAQPPIHGSHAAAAAAASNGTGTGGSQATLSSMLSPQDLSAELNLTTEFPSSADIQAIRPLFAAYITPPYSPDPDALSDLAGSEQIRSYLQTLVNQLVTPSLLLPGRTFAVKIKDTDQDNANMDMYQTMRVYRGMFQSSSPTYLIGTLCHEMTHSARNHGLKFGATYENLLDPSLPAVAAYYAKLTAFETKYLNEKTNTYTHNVAAYQDLLASYGPVMSVPLMHSRRHESEADIIGGIICAMNGMTTNDYIQTYYEDVLSNQQNPQIGPGGAQLKDGDMLQINDGDMDDFVQNVLLMDPAHSTHPTPEQRYNQLQQFKSLMDQFYDPSGPLASATPTQTVQAYAASLAPIAGASLALAGGAPSPTAVRLVRVTRADGSVLFLHSGHACTGTGD